jgi:hypothetical protein
MSLELQSIERALHTAQITPDEAEYLIQQRYQVARIQFEVFTLLQDALEQEIRHLSDKTKSFLGKGSDGAVAARLAACSSCSQGQSCGERESLHGFYNLLTKVLPARTCLADKLKMARWSGAGIPAPSGGKDGIALRSTA